MEILEERVNIIEDSLAELIEIHKETEYRIQRLEREMREFKEEMREFKDEMRAAEKRSEKERREMNKRWGEISNKMGTIVEDIIFPATRPLIKRYFKCNPLFLANRVQRRKGDRLEEFDVISACEDKVFLIEVKSTLRPKHIEEFKEKMRRFREFFPEYKGKKLISIFASLSIDDNFINMLSKEGIYAMAYREWDYMDILNFEKISEKKEYI